ncbi:hypothetical protein CLAIMM_12306 [Cladophialophora immunda]|nr:hypothetical protein CLAIMM_12306 [Cladophialophora immunda]
MRLPRSVPRAAISFGLVANRRPTMASHQSRWRWNDIPDYERSLTKEILEKRLREMFGNYKFLVERKASTWTFWVPDDLTVEEKIRLQKPHA